MPDRFFSPANPHPGTGILNLGRGDGLSTQSFPFFEGTIGCALQGDGRLYLLTCSHVAAQGSAINYGGDLLPGTLPPVILQPAPLPLGTWSFALLDDQFDLALVSPSAEQAAAIQPAGAFSMARSVTKDDAAQRTPLSLLGYKSGLRSGEVVQVGVSANFDYAGQPVQLANLVAVGAPSGAGIYLPISQPGDSGAIAYDNSGFALGMVMGCTTQFTYLIPMDAILGRLGMTIY